MRYVVWVALCCFILACREDSKKTDNINKININFIIERFDSAYAEAKPNDLPQLKRAFPFLFSKNVPDSVWVNRINDPLQDQLLKEVSIEYSDLNDIEIGLKRLFQHIAYYNKSFSTPRVITLINDVDYRNKTIITDSLVLVALDNFLGEQHQFYQNIPRYLAKNMARHQILPELARAYAKKNIFQRNRRTFLDEMIYYGKQYYFLDNVLPKASDAHKIGYTEQELRWAAANESPIWSHFVEKEMLFSTDSKLLNRFIADAPFSKFYLQLDNESPGRIGQYMGWQIVKAYGRNTKVSLMEILKKEPEEIFNKAKFKPKK